MHPFVKKMEEVQAPKDGAVLFWLEQSHFILKADSGKYFHFDPFISRVVKPENHIYPEPVLPPEECPADWVFLTHDHRDHTDIHTIGPLAEANPQCRFIGTPEACEHIIREAGVAPEKTQTLSPGEKAEEDAFSLEAVFALDTDDPPTTTHQGYVLRLGNIIVYHTGDTQKGIKKYAEKMKAVQDLRPTVMMVPINKKHDNPGPKGARFLMEWTRARLVVPCHYDCFSHNTVDPQEFIDRLTLTQCRDVRLMSRGGNLLLSRH